MGSRQTRGFRWVVLLLVLSLVAAACGSDSTETEQTTEPEPEEEVAEPEPEEPQRLLVWNKDETETFQELVRQFQENNPGVEIELVDRSFENYDTAVALALTSDNPPDVLQQSFAYKAMGAYVKAGEVLVLDAYADQYDWWTRLATGAASLSFSPDGLDYGVGNLYGVAAQGEVVGVYYNKAKTAALGIEEPTTFSEFEAALATAEAGGELAINLGGLTPWTLGQAYHVIQNALVPAAVTLDFVYNVEGSTFETPENIRAAQLMRDWSEAGYFSPDALGFDYPSSLTSFGGGEGVFMFQGSWANGALAADLGDDLGFFGLPNEEGDVIAVTSTFGASWGIGANTASPDLAAEFIDWVTGETAAELMAQAGNLPGYEAFTTTKPEPGSSQEAQWDLWTLASSEGIQTNFLGQAAAEIGGVQSAGLQEVWAGLKDPADWAAEMQASKVEFHLDYG